MKIRIKMKSILFLLLIVFSFGVSGQLYSFLHVVSDQCFYSTKDSLFYQRADSSKLCSCYDTNRVVIPVDNSVSVNYYYKFSEGHLNEYIFENGAVSTRAAYFLENNKIRDGWQYSYDNLGRVVEKTLFIKGKWAGSSFMYSYGEISNKSSDTTAKYSQTISNIAAMPEIKGGDYLQDSNYMHAQLSVLEDKKLREISIYQDSSYKTWKFSDFDKYYLVMHYTVRFIEKYNDKYDQKMWYSVLLGDYYEYYESGQVKIKGFYKELNHHESVQDGSWYFYNEDGTLNHVELWENGKCDGKEPYEYWKNLIW